MPSRHSTPRPSPFKHPDCGDKLRSPRHPKPNRKRLFRDESDHENDDNDDDDDDDDNDKTTSPSRHSDPLEAPIRHILPLIAHWSEAVEGPPHDHLESMSFRLQSEGRDTNPSNFRTLSTATGITQAVKARSKEFRHRDMTNGKAVTFGKPFVSSKMKVSQNMYKGSDDIIPLTPLANTPNGPGWLHASRPDDKIELRERDISHWEGQARIALRILSLLELINQAMRRGAYSISCQNFQDLCSINVRAVKDLIKLTTSNFLNMVQLRRDNILQKLKLTTDQLFDLRHSECTTQKYLFPQELVKEIDSKHLQNLQNRVLTERYQTPSRRNYGGGGPSQRSRGRHNSSGSRRTTPSGSQSAPAAMPSHQTSGDRFSRGRGRGGKSR